MFVETKPEGEAQTELEPWRQLLLDAADYMEKHGHCKHLLYNDEGEVCFLGALNAACYGSASACGISNTYNIAARMMARHVNIAGYVNIAFIGVSDPAVVWNNDPNRAGAEVVAGMRECALTVNAGLRNERSQFSRRRGWESDGGWRAS